ncbi:MAG: RNA-guided pseudouridylation complex pseudouridine synthase subunit Cbf5 [Candidatus Ranarchaeia archaeon]
MVNRFEKVPLLPKKMVDRTSAITDPAIGVDPYQRTPDELINFGIINLNKPPGPTSHEVVAWVKQMLKIDIAGHSGTLDPQVTGVLPTALGSGTKILQALLNSDKEYIGVMQLRGDVSLPDIKRIARLLTGEIWQRPPLRSSVKRTLRTRTIYRLEVLEKENRNVLFKVKCEAGTYIRKLCVDWGELLQVGAHMIELRRIQSGPFSEEINHVSLHDVKDAYSDWVETRDEVNLRKTILPLEAGLTHIPHVVIRDSAVDAICHGAKLAAPGVVKISPKTNTGDMVAISTLKGEIVALGTSLVPTQKALSLDHGFIVKPIRVIMPTGTYEKAKS